MTTAHFASLRTELQLRLLRDSVYGHPISDHEWQNCKDHWSRPEAVEWLEAEASKMASVKPVADTAAPPASAK